MRYLLNNYKEVLIMLFQHIEITTITFLIALAIAFPIGIFCSKNEKLSKIIMKVFGTLYTIPSMALFALLIPITGLGMKTAVITLVCYSQFILVRNITKGLLEVPKDVIDAALGIGYDTKSLFFKIKLPLAAPVILEGVRIALVSIISITTIAAWINAGGLGNLIFQGLSQNNSTKIIIGTALVALLSILTNKAISTIEKRLFI